MFPSARARTTSFAAIVQAAPVVFFTTTGAPSMGVNSVASSRATMSAAEAEPKLVTLVIGVCAFAAGTNHAAADRQQAAAITQASLRNVQHPPSRSPDAREGDAAPAIEAPGRPGTIGRHAYRG